ncbi:MAG: alpha-ketoglutarate-dependent dioxygenase AlkB [Rhodobacteraceae bacterium]|nr:alpha-ketoglutarate-dependent dioxygenase AlkB [Paracoccaceae bacterium]
MPSMSRNFGERPEPDAVIRDVEFFVGLLNPEAQARLVAEIRSVAEAAPVFSPQTRYGRPMSVRMTSAGAFGWFSDRKGYRYLDRHPTGVAWPPIPETALAVWRLLVPDGPDPECCLINYYGEGARMGMHQDRDEADFRWPVVSLSLGDEALFRIGGMARGGSTESRWLRSGDVVVMGGAARLIHHGIDRIAFGSSALLPRGGRINLTLRVVR